jgi:calcium-dependent protein kinase
MIKKTRYRFPPSSTTPLSDSVKDLISKLLLRDPLARLTAEQVLQHPWIAGDTASDQLISDVVVENLGAFRTQVKLKKAVARALVANLTDVDKAVLADAFKRFDKNNDGKLSPDEITDLMKSIGKGPEEAQKWMQEVDQNNDGVINEEEFKQGYAVAVLGSSEEQLRGAFAMFDKDKNGFVSAQEIEQVCNFLTPAAVKQLVGEVDKNNDGQISVQEWMVAMKDIDKKMGKK